MFGKKSIPQRRKLYLVSAVGQGRTEISAFDNALHNAGIANYNLLTLSSVIPPNTEIEVVEKLNWNDKEFGDRLYCVMARQITTTFGEQACAGIGWVQSDVDGRGLFVEHHAESEETVKKLVDNSLSDMVKYRPTEFGGVHSEIIGIECVDKPVCAIVVAVYQAEPW